MTDKAVSALTSLTGANTATGDLLYIVDISEAAAADRSKKITAQELQNYLKTFPATIGVGGATPAASGAGISFPATASASSDANTLDDYEEGDFSSSLAVAGATSAGTGTYTTKNGSYTKIGNVVQYQIYLVVTAHTGTGGLLITGLPFTAKAGSIYAGGSIGYLQNLALTASNVPTFYVLQNSTIIEVYQYPVGGGAASQVQIDTDFQLILSGTYLAA